MFMKYILILAIIVGIEWNLQWFNNENQPNWVKAIDENGQEVALQETRERVDGVWYWNAWSENESFFLNFWIY